jgi:hypothetical protein
MIAMRKATRISEPTIDNHIVKLKASGAGRPDQHHDAEIRGADHQDDGRDRWKALQIVANVSTVGHSAR